MLDGLIAAVRAGRGAHRLGCSAQDGSRRNHSHRARAVHTRRQSPAPGRRLTPIATATELTGSGYHRIREPSPRRSDFWGRCNRSSGHVTMRVAFVLSGGASLGASQAGMLQALYEHRIRPDLLLGASAGAINAAFIASRPPTPSTARDLQRLWRGLGRARVYSPPIPSRPDWGCSGCATTPVSAGSLRRLVLRHLELDRLEDAPVELHVVAADALSGEEVLLSSGPAIDAVLARAAIRGVPGGPVAGAAADRRRDRQQHADLARHCARRRSHHRAAGNRHRTSPTGTSRRVNLPGSPPCSTQSRDA